jgi:signal transduction histidine kinase
MDLHAQLLLRQADLPPAARESAAQIRVEARQLTRMIVNLLDLSKGDEGKLEARGATLQLSGLLEKVFSELGAAAEARNVRLETVLEVHGVWADEDLLRRVLTNLVENAIRHAPSHSVVRVDSTRAEGGALLRVSDDGSGVPKELVTHIFDPFVQAEAAAGQALTRTGRGLGLAFCRVAVEAHGGRIWVENRSPGALFCVWLKEP